MNSRKLTLLYQRIRVHNKYQQQQERRRHYCSIERVKKLSAQFRRIASECGEDVEATVLEPDLKGGDASLDKYTTCWRGKWGVKGGEGRGNIVLRPSTTECVRGFVELCNKEGAKVVPQGGNTGLVGGGVPEGYDEVVLSTVRLNSVMSLDSSTSVITLSSGVILSDAIRHCADLGMLYPVDIGSKGTCNVGGNVSSNAGGIYFTRFGSIRDNLVGLTAVTGRGDVLEVGGCAMRKDSKGMDLRQVFVGGEGAFGIITMVKMRVWKKPTTREVAVVGVGGWEEVERLCERAQERMGGLVSAVEVMDRRVLELVKEKVGGGGMGWVGGARYYVLVETMGFDDERDRETLERFLEEVMEEGTVEDGVMAKGEEEIEAIWGVRESCGVAVNRAGGSWKYDVSLELRDWEEVGRMVEEKVRGLGGRLVIWGHLGDRNVHFNVVREKEDGGEGSDITDAIEPWLYEEVIRRGGSVSAEHGIGQCKGDLMEELIVGEAGMEYLRGIKQLFDPNHILNVGRNKTFRERDK
ncbi:hypothetical protein TrRE_jg4223 [Triparma retinervis]|uniref:FAD-binding PCMH-type domain-containing protein n=1 Tax=Triparma retinervis TaxID=2557542 RepID=A0A9W7E2H7_9STRA|nr:hypothetical protein TrRE_jg4223 [Triparma retinervis]